RLYPIAILGLQPENQGEVFAKAQIKFSDTLKENRPFIQAAICQAFEDFEGEIIVWKGMELPPDSRRNDVRERVRIALDGCDRQIRNRFSGEVLLPGEGKAPC